MNIAGQDIEKLAIALRTLAPSIQPSAQPAWTREPALKVLDCVLSLNRNYLAFVEPRIVQFESAYPDVDSVRDLQGMINSYSAPFEFMKLALRYKHEERAKTLTAVVDWLVRDVTGVCSGDAELTLLEAWAKDASFSSAPRIRGFGLAGFQYLRMLFKANTVKPDVWIKRFVSEQVGYNVSEHKALSLLELAAPVAGVRSLRDFDTTVWERDAIG